MKNTHLVRIAFAAGMLLVGRVQAAQIFQEGFETPAAPLANILPVSSYGWTLSIGGGGAYVWYPNSSVNDFNSVNPLAAPADGNQLLFVQNSSSVDTFVQRSVATIGLNTNYTLTVAVGVRAAIEPPASWGIQLWAGNTNVLTTLLGQTVFGGAGAVQPTAGNWANNSVIFDSATAPSEVGKELFIVLENFSGGPTFSVFFDNVRLDAVASVPEPSMTILFGLGCLVLCWRHRPYARTVSEIKSREDLSYPHIVP